MLRGLAAGFMNQHGIITSIYQQNLVRRIWLAILAETILLDTMGELHRGSMSGRTSEEAKKARQRSHGQQEYQMRPT